MAARILREDERAGEVCGWGLGREGKRERDCYLSSTKGGKGIAPCGVQRERERASEQEIEKGGGKRERGRYKALGHCRYKYATSLQVGDKVREAPDEPLKPWLFTLLRRRGSGQRISATRLPRWPRSDGARHVQGGRIQLPHSKTAQGGSLRHLIRR